MTNEAQYGYGLDVDTSPPELGRLPMRTSAISPRAAIRARWDDAGALTPVQRYADMFSGTGLPGLDGTAWYHPRRLTIDAGAVAAGNPNPAQEILDVDAIHGADLRRETCGSTRSAPPSAASGCSTPRARSRPSRGSRSAT